MILVLENYGETDLAFHWNYSQRKRREGENGS
jgi:hypothetical protein